ncbi:hypothetical protein HDU93_004302 [Gonapodya sp. JEL0774]|nr:hypothetical protein HDU93_004302 [Gonapodya sp. JEL0774]
MDATGVAPTNIFPSAGLAAVLLAPVPTLQVRKFISSGSTVESEKTKSFEPLTIKGCADRLQQITVFELNVRALYLAGSFAARCAGLLMIEATGPSAVAYSDKSGVPRETSQDDLDTIVQAFTEAATRADRAGFDVLEIHGAPAAPSRTVPVFCTYRITKAVRDVWPQRKPPFTRLPSTD